MEPQASLDGAFRLARFALKAQEAREHLNGQLVEPLTRLA